MSTHSMALLFGIGLLVTLVCTLSYIVVAFTELAASATGASVCDAITRWGDSASGWAEDVPGTGYRVGYDLADTHRVSRLPDLLTLLKL